MRAASASQPALAPEQGPSPEHPRGLALCLSGGGFRAVLFHLGALRRLNEMGLLAKVDTLSATSGGSILAAHLATVIAKDPTKAAAFTPEAWDQLVEAPLRALTREDLQTGFRTLQLLARTLLRPHARVEALAKRYEEILTPLKLRDLPPAPRFVFCATDFLRSVPWLFERDRMGDRQLGWATPPDGATLARAVAASSCFPRSISPLPAPLDPALLSGGAAPPGPDRDAAIRHLALGDGASHAHLGLDPVWKTHTTVLVSEAGAYPKARQKRRLFPRPDPFPTGVDSEGQEIRRRRLVSGFVGGHISGTFWSISSAPSSYRVPFGYSKALARDVLCTMRAGLDPVTEAEAAVLLNHGYLTADAALRAHTPQLLPRIVPRLQLPDPGWTPADPDIERRVRVAFARSARRGRWWRR
ncbi:MAG: patatin-like phospholipase family protein [Deltaproteobacteria bacterium]|nr:patatin-like phospholipase family protein [Deltaproteobacteria bacterium]